MSLDSICLAAIKEELINTFKEGKIVNIFQVKKYKIIFEIKSIRTLPPSNREKKTKTFYLHISIDPSLMEIFFSESGIFKETIGSPFLTILQNQLIGGKILDIKHPDFDRILHFIAQPYSKFGHTRDKILIVEFMGKHSNIILLNEDNIIEGSIKPVTLKTNRYREIISGKLYIPPPPQNKINPLLVNKQTFIDLFHPCDSIEISLWKFLQNNFKGMNQQNIEEIILQANLIPEKKAANISENDIELLWFSFNKMIERIKNNNYRPVIFTDSISGKIKTYSVIDSTKFTPYDKQYFDDVNSCFKYFFSAKEKERDILSLRVMIDDILDKNITKLSNKIKDYQKTLEEARSCEKYKLSGELIKSNLSLIKRGDKEITTINYYSPDQENITIPLENKLTPLQNAGLYFKKYRKMKDSVKIISTLLNNGNLKLSQLVNLKSLYIKSENSLSGLQKIYNDLEKSRFTKKTKTVSKKREKSKNKLIPSKYISRDGWEIYVGKNNQQNDFLTMKFASGNDIWLHIKNIKGAHVVIKNKGINQNPPLNTLVQAGHLAAYFSKSKNETKVLIDYTLKKYVKKPKNANPGMVTYSHEKSLLIKISPQEIKNIIAQNNP